jgi:predicted S18 family serine protease
MNRNGPRRQEEDRTSRRDLELAHVLRTATILADVRPACSNRPATPERPQSLSVPAFVLMLVLLLALPVAAAVRFRHREPALLTDAASFVHMRGVHASTGRFYVISVTTSSPHGARLAQAQLGIEASQDNALAAALRCVGTSKDGSRIRFETHGHTGGSGGLMYALEIGDALDSRDLAKGRNIAGTGTITADGAVGPILSIALKARAAERWGADLFMAPSSQVTEARHAAPTLRVVGVRTLDEAIRALTAGQGCR